MLLKKISVLSMTLALVACVAPPKFQDTRQPNKNETFALGSSALLQPTNHTVRHINVEKNIIYTQTFGGGGLALGLLLGPAGTAANYAMINSATDADTHKLSNKIPVDPVKSFSNAARLHNFSLTDATNPDSRITPYLYIVKTSESSLNIATGLIYEPSIGTASKYMLQLPGTYTVEELSSLSPEQASMLQSTVDSGFEQLLGFFSREGSESPLGQPIKYKSAFISPRFDFTLDGSVAAKDDHITWIRTYGGLYGLRNGTFSVSY